LLLETATLLLMGKELNKQVHLLPQVARKLEVYFTKLPLPKIDNRKHCVCTECTDCLCDFCYKWKKISTNSINELADIYRGLLRQDLINEVQGYLGSLQEQPEVFVGVHIRRTDYLDWIIDRYKGNPVDEHYFIYAMNLFRSRYKNVKFFVTSDDLPWCKEKFNTQDVVFPVINKGRNNSIEQDFIFLTQMNKTIYDYGSFGFWAAVLAGGDTMLADNYSKKLHPLLAAIKENPPDNWNTLDVNLTVRE